MRWEITTTATSPECRTLRRFSAIPTERAFLVIAENRLQALTKLKGIDEKILRISRCVDDDHEIARDAKAVARAIRNHAVVETPSPVEELVTR